MEMDDTPWDVKKINPKWAIRPKVQLKLPFLASATKDESESLADRFLNITELRLPRLPSATRTATPGVDGTALLQGAFDEVKNISEDAITMTEKTKKDYFGIHSKAEFQKVFKKIAAQQYLYQERTEDFINEQEKYLKVIQDDGEEQEEYGILAGPLTARHRFAAMCAEDNLLPCGSIILRKTFTPHINLAHMSIGDNMAVKLAEVLKEIPMVTSLNIRDNRLTDLGVGSIVNCIIQKSDLRYLDLSQNKVDGEASEALAAYVNSSSCSLSELKLSNADVDDEEVQGFTEALHVNRTMNTLDLSHNLIGTVENLNVVQPDLITGGEAIAEMLVVNNTLTKLDLSWNSIRMESAVEMGKALAQNTGLKELNLSYNAFACSGAQAIGDALQSNNCLEHLNLSNNNIPGRGAFVISRSLHVNSSLTSLILDGNPLGAMGGRALLQSVADSPQVSFKLSVENCNFDMISQDMFDPQDATGKYDLDMRSPYERSIAIELLRLAGHKNGCRFISIVHSSTSMGSNGKLQQQKQTINVALQTMSTMRATLSRRPKSRGKIESMDRDKLEQVFKELDCDYSGSIDAEELEIGMRTFGLDPQPGEMARLIAQYDLDETGTIEIDEFVELMAEFEHNEEPMREIVDTATGFPFTIPTDGFLKIEFLDTHCIAENKEASSREGIERLIANLDGGSSVVKMMKMAKKGMCVKAVEAQLLVDAVVEETDIISALCMILPLVIDGRQAHQLIESNLNRKQRMKLQMRLGHMYGPLVGLSTGHYELDLSEEGDRFIARRLMELSNKTSTYRKNNNLADTSQKNNRLGFRNEALNGVQMTLQPEFFDNMPKFGKLEVDFVDMMRPAKDVKPLSDARFKQVMKHLHLEKFEPIEMPLIARKSTTKCFDTLRSMRDRRTSTIPIEFQSPEAKEEEVYVTLDDGTEILWNGRRILMELQAALSNRYITVAQAIKILQAWPICYTNIRIEAVVILFARVVDLYHFYQLTNILTDEESGSCFYRIGFLNIWSPIAPDQYYELDLSIPEQRVVAQMLVRLAIDEPGENWQDETFGWTRDEPMLGWELNVGWLKPGGFPEKGILSLHYYSGADLGCAPIWPTRKELMNSVLADLPPNFDKFADAMSRSLIKGVQC